MTSIISSFSNSIVIQKYCGGSSYHASKFMDGYYSGFDNCSKSYPQADEYQSEDNSYNSDNFNSNSQNDQNRGPAINCENICDDVEFLLNLKEPCYEDANGNQLTEKVNRR